MPRSKDSKKSKKSSNALKEASSSSAGQCENVRPPNPEESNLVACNPFDEAPKLPASMPVRMVHASFTPQPMTRLQHGGPMGYTGWNKSDMTGLRPGYGGFAMGPHGFANNSMPVGNMMRPSSYHTHPSVPSGHNGYGISRIPYGSMPYRQRMIGNGYRSSMPTGPMVSEGMLEPQGMMTGPVGAGHIVPLNRHPGPMGHTQQIIRRGSSSSAKSNLSNERKSPKTSENSKSKKKSEKKTSQENRSKNVENEKPMNNGIEPSLNSGNATPNSSSQPANKFCKTCSNEINPSSDEYIQCRASCNLWYHRCCVGLNETAYKFLITEECALWACDSCIHTKEIHAIRSKPNLNSILPTST